LTVAVIVTVVLMATATVVSENVAVVAPAATVTEAGVLVELLLSESVTASPPVGAALEMVTVPVEEAPPTTEVGFTVTDDTVGELTVNVAVWDVLLAVAVIVELVLEATATVVAVNVAVVAPDATVTELGTVTEGLLLDRIT